MRVDDLLFEQLLEETEDVLSREQAVMLANEKCSDIQGVPLYRGESLARYNAAIVKPYEKPTRRSLTGNDILLEMTSESPRWKDFPPRNKSIFMTPSKKDANAFGGNIYKIFPSNESRLGVSHLDDFNAMGAFPYADEYLDREYPGYAVQKLVREYVEILITESGLEADVYKYLRVHHYSDLKELDDLIRQEIINKKIESFQSLTDKLRNYPSVHELTANSIVDLIDELFDPYKNKFESLTPKEFVAKYSEDDRVEVWTNATVVAILEEP